MIAGEYKRDDPKANQFDWEAWYKQIENLYNQAFNNSDDELFKYNMGTKLSGTRMLLEMKELIEPETYVITFPPGSVVPIDHELENAKLVRRILRGGEMDV